MNTRNAFIGLINDANMSKILFADIGYDTCISFIDMQHKYEYDFTRNYLYLKNMNQYINTNNDNLVIKKNYPNDIKSEYETYTHHELDEFKMTQYVSSFFNTQIEPRNTKSHSVERTSIDIETILREFDFMNPIHHIISTSDTIKKICNMLVIKILANSLTQIEFCVKVSKKIKGTDFLTINSITEFTSLANKLLDDNIRIPNYQSLCTTYPTDTQHILNWFPNRYKNKDSRLVTILTMMIELITNQKKLFSDKNEYVICNSIDVVALIGNNLSLENMVPIHIDHAHFYNYKLIEDIIKNNTCVDNIEPIIIEDLVMPNWNKYAGNIVIEI